MRHRVKGRRLGRNGSHRKAMFSNMAASLIKTLDDSGGDGAAKVPGRIVTTVAKAKELRPRVEKLITLARKAAAIQSSADALLTTAERGRSEVPAERPPLSHKNEQPLVLSADRSARSAESETGRLGSE